MVRNDVCVNKGLIRFCSQYSDPFLYHIGSGKSRAKDFGFRASYGSGHGRLCHSS